MDNWLKTHEKGSLLLVYARPGASNSQLSGVHGDRLKIKIAAIAQDGEANLELIEFLAKILTIAKSKIHLLRGESSKQKDLVIELSRDQIKERLLVHLK